MTIPSFDTIDPAACACISCVFHSLLYMVDTENRGAGDLEFVVIAATSSLAAIN